MVRAPYGSGLARNVTEFLLSVAVEISAKVPKRKPVDVF